MRYILTLLLCALSLPAYAAEGAAPIMDIDPKHVGAMLCIAIFVIAYALVLAEEKIHLLKSKPVMMGAGLIWIVIALVAPSHGVDHDMLHNAVFHGLSEFASLMLFLLAAMTYINALQERGVFDALRVRMVRAGLSMRQIFWVTGVAAFFLSPVADNMTTALVMGAVVMAVGQGNAKFIALACINIVSAANAGGAFSPFGDITTLMVWQAGHVDFFEFFALFWPSVVCFLVPAACMHFAVPKERPQAIVEDAPMKKGAVTIIILGLLTIVTAITFEQVLGLPAFLGMMTGMGALMLAAHGVHRFEKKNDSSFDIMRQIALAEWDTLLFFFGVIFSVSGLAFLGYMELASNAMYEGWGHSMTNIFMGFTSAVIDNIPVMFAILTMNPEMTHFQWMLVTLTTGVGGSMLSVGSAAGVALMGTARGHYTFLSHLKWTPVIVLGYAAAVWIHFLINSGASHGGL